MSCNDNFKSSKLVALILQRWTGKTTKINLLFGYKMLLQQYTPAVNTTMSWTNLYIKSVHFDSQIDIER